MNQHVARYHREFPQKYRLEAAKCRNCSGLFFPPRLICSKCGEREFENLPLSGRGTIGTFTIIRIPPSGFEDLAPYALGIVDLEEGCRVMGQITDCDPEKLKIGDPVVTQFRRINEEGKTGMILYGYKFVPDHNL